MVLIRNISDFSVYVEISSNDKESNTRRAEQPNMKRLAAKESNIIECPSKGVCAMKVYGDGSKELWSGYVPVDDETLYIDGEKNIVFIMNDENPTIIPQSTPEKGELQEILDSIDSTIETYKPGEGGTCSLSKMSNEKQQMAGLYEWVKLFLVIMAVIAIMWYVYKYYIQQKKR